MRYSLLNNKKGTDPHYDIPNLGLIVVRKRHKKITQASSQSRENKKIYPTHILELKC